VCHDPDVKHCHSEDVRVARVELDRDIFEVSSGRIVKGEIRGGR
jgi:hypothetical protein